ncbi:hypothetical protein EXIGLDRAFT_846605 [Exidia glandulosa HHB12029]|uniref:Uncharacterized protein n=1 Tax=Exidia glandulosa HHB12029 TaxID=1314781 RepID=A0A165Z4X9_EXIGL|nr:hypothetical protein EXIGLDRAFT_846605 [Exidia glandulosa HHB12029]
MSPVSAGNNSGTQAPAHLVAGRKGVSSTPLYTRPPLVPVDGNSGFVAGVATDSASGLPCCRTIYTGTSGQRTTPASTSRRSGFTDHESADALTALVRRVDPSLHAKIDSNTSSAHLALHSAVARMRSSMPPFIPGSIAAPSSVPLREAPVQAYGAAAVGFPTALHRPELSPISPIEMDNVGEGGDVLMPDEGVKISDDELLWFRMQQMTFAQQEIDALPDWLPELSFVERVLWRTAWNDTAGTFAGSFEEWRAYTAASIASTLAGAETIAQPSLEELAATYLRPVIADTASNGLGRTVGRYELGTPNIDLTLVEPVVPAHPNGIQAGRLEDARVCFKSWVSDRDEVMEMLDLQPSGTPDASQADDADWEFNASTSFPLFIDDSPFFPDSNVPFDDM